MKMSGKYSVLLFDLDGTLTDPGEGIRNSVAYALQKYGINVTEQELLNRFIGPPLQEGFQEFYGFSSKEAIRAVGYYREYYGEKGIFQNKLYDGIPGMLEKLQANGIALLVATSKPELYAKEIIQHFHLESFFLYIAGGNMDGTRCKKQEDKRRQPGYQQRSLYHLCAEQERRDIHSVHLRGRLRLVLIGADSKADIRLLLQQLADGRRAAGREYASGVIIWLRK